MALVTARQVPREVPGPDYLPRNERKGIVITVSEEGRRKGRMRMNMKEEEEGEEGRRKGLILMLVRLVCILGRPTAAG